MGRSRTINHTLGEIAAEHCKRILARQRTDPTFKLSESDAKVLKVLAEAQVILQRRKPEDGDGVDGDVAGGMTIEELERHTSGQPEKPPSQDADDDAGR